MTSGNECAKIATSSFLVIHQAFNKKPMTKNEKTLKFKMDIRLKKTDDAARRHWQNGVSRAGKVCFFYISSFSSLKKKKNERK